MKRRRMSDAWTNACRKNEFQRETEYKKSGKAFGAAAFLYYETICRGVRRRRRLYFYQRTF